MDKLENVSTIHGYSLVKKMSSSNAGFSEWGIGAKDGKQYFIKKLLKPIYPMDEDSIYREERLEACNKFVERQISLLKAINEINDPIIVRVKEFFRKDGRYYIITDLIDDIGYESIKSISMDEKIKICMKICRAVEELHEKGIIHGDIKLDNILFCNSDDGIEGKVIDVDSCFYMDNMPDSEQMIGDFVYMAPETQIYKMGGENNITSKIDSFACGLLFHKILTGSMPDYDKNSYNYPVECVLDGAPIMIDKEIPTDIGNMISEMLLKDPQDRMELKQASSILQEYVTNAFSGVQKWNEWFTIAGDL